MMDFLRRHNKLVFIVVLLFLLGGVFIGFGNYFFGGRTPNDPVASVNGERIPYRRFAALMQQSLDNLRRSGTEITRELTAMLQQQVLQELVSEEVLWQQSRKYGITVTDTDVLTELRSNPYFQKEGVFDRDLYFNVITRALHMTPAEFETTLRKQIAIAKLNDLVASSVRISEPELKQAYAEEHNGSTAGFARERDEFLETYRRERMSMVFASWMKSLDETTDIDVYLDQFRSPGA